MTNRTSSDLRNLIASAVWQRVTQEDGSWDDLWPVDREEFLGDADAVLASLVAEGYSLPAAPPSDSPADSDQVASAAIDALAREAVYRMVQASAAVVWQEYPGLAERDWELVVSRVMDNVASVRPDSATLLDAYEFLAAKSEACRA